ncbi:MAG: DUF2157 domain-containing protein [Hyphomicrobium sp.]|nr:DUF2157 domain-containing protein [Hyphomicrobium sp.]
MWSYRKRLEKDLLRWRDAGWVTADGEARIRTELAQQGQGFGLPAALAILASVLIGFAVMSFVAANWQDMPRLARLGLIFALLWASYGFGAVLLRRGLEVFAHGAILLGTSVFGAGIMLVSQMYHIDGNPPDAVLVWGLGALLAGLAFRSNATLAFALVLFSFWGAWETAQREAVFWPYLVAWLAVTVAFAWQRWAPGAHLSGFTLSGFFVVSAYVWYGGQAHMLVVALGLAMGAAMVAGRFIVPHLDQGWRTGFLYAYLTAFAGMLALQFAESPELTTFIVQAAFAITLALAAIWWGLSEPDRAAVWLGYLGFSIEILAIYGKTVGTLMGTSVFFLSAGVVVAALAYLAYRLHQSELQPARPEVTP